MKNLIFSIVGLMLFATTSHAQSYLDCRAMTSAKDGSGLVEPRSVTVTNSGDVVTVKIVGIQEALKSRVILQKSTDMASQQLIKVVKGADFVNTILKSGNATKNVTDGSLELKFDRSECLVSQVDSKLIRCAKKDYSGTFFTSERKTRELVTSEEKSISFTKLEISLSTGIPSYKSSNSNLETPFSYYKCN